jgi:hypothetical protein
MKKLFPAFSLILILILPLLCTASFAQTPVGSLTGKVADQTGAVIPQATVTVTAAGSKPVSATSDPSGAFVIHNLPPGTYSVAATAQGFAPFKKDGVTLTAGQTQTLNLTLEIQTQQEKVEVQAEPGTSLDVSSSSNAGSLVIKGKDLEALSDDPDELQSELQALAGPSAGPNGGQIYIDGFTGGQLPPKSAIREIRINQNPFSAQYDKLGYGRIEIFTKPGSDKLHGQIMFNDNNAILNSRNPYVPTKPDYNSEIFDGNISGPISKKASFFIDAQRRNNDEFSAINATILDSMFNPVQLQESISNPRTHTNFSPRLDYQISGNNTLTMRYQLTHDTNQNGGLGTFSLPSQAYDVNSTEQTLQLSDSQIVSPKIVNETRFQFQHDNTHQLPFSTGISLQVQGAFTGGGSSGGDSRTTQNNYELQNYTSIAHGNHFIKFGGRFRGITTSNSSSPNFNGSFVFSPVFTGVTPVDALTVYQNAAQGNCSSVTYSATNCPSQFSITIGTPLVQVNWFDAGLYAEDEWRIRPNLSLTYGLRFESQNDIHDHADIAPRLGIAWGVGSDGKSAPKTVLRGGFGIFYDRFGYNLVQQAERLNGITQQSLVIQNPDFYTANPANLPSFSTLQAMSTASPTIYQIDPNVRAPYTMQGAASVERQITKAATLSLTYLNSRGEHALYIRNANAPFAPGGPPPNPTAGNIYQYDSEGIFRQNQLIANVRFALGKKVSLFGFYTLGYANSNVSSGGGGGGFGSGLTSSASFLSNQYDPEADYGRAAFDVRHRAFIGGSIDVPYGFRLAPFIIINSGQPYNITTGTDLNGDSIFNDRPVLLSTATCGAVSVTGTNYCTPLGTFGAALPTSGQTVLPVNYETGPANATFNLRVSKTFGFGKEAKGSAGGGGGGGQRGGYPGGGLGGRGLSGAGGGGNPFGGATTSHRYNLTFSISGRNIFNTVAPSTPIGNLSSPFFGQSIALGGPFSSASSNRRVDLQVMLAF